MNFNPSRKQRNVAIQKEPDFDRVEKYKILQYELKQELKQRHEKEKQFWEITQTLKNKKSASLSLPALAEKATDMTAVTQLFNKIAG